MRDREHLATKGGGSTFTEATISSSSRRTTTILRAHHQTRIDRSMGGALVTLLFSRRSRRSSISCGAIRAFHRGEAFSPRFWFRASWDGTLRSSYVPDARIACFIAALLFAQSGSEEGRPLTRCSLAILFLAAFGKSDDSGDRAHFLGALAATTACVV
jgi:hypothetical protein